jgi:hypothetical protein
MPDAVDAKLTLSPALKLFISWMLADARRSLYGCCGCQKVTLVTVDAKGTFSWMPWMTPGRFVDARAKVMDVGCQKYPPVLLQLPLETETTEVVQTHKEMLLAFSHNYRNMSAGQMVHHNSCFFFFNFLTFLAVRAIGHYGGIMSMCIL